MAALGTEYTGVEELRVLLGQPLVYTSLPRTETVQPEREILRQDFTSDWPVINGIKSISGTIYRDDGSYASGCKVKLFRQHDDAFIAELTADISGLYAFPRDAQDPYEYYVMAYIVNADSTVAQVHGVSDRGVIPK